ncbi:hypothetical protein VFPBJ_03735 [Purpureocillium lilacinum]|uniref:Uncharacterized protein n=1 Tax=Purpureocillium lilacinum TaxID=33203 RepID=A0A179H437_PURLI|nr:hypothetical protein VFPBJ_03735 [Purpureocillium lilacinum]
MSKLFLITGLAVAAVHSAGAGEEAKAPQKKCFLNVGAVRNLNEYDANADTGCDWETKRAIFCMQTNGTQSDATNEQATMYRACLWGNGDEASSYDKAQADCLACKTASGELTEEEAGRWAKAQKTAKGLFLQNLDIRGKSVWEVVQEANNNGTPGEDSPEDGATGNGTQTSTKQPPSPSTLPTGGSEGNETAAGGAGSGTLEISQSKFQSWMAATFQANRTVEFLHPYTFGNEALVSGNGTTGNSTATGTVEETSQLRVVQAMKLMKSVVRFEKDGMGFKAVFVSQVNNFILTSHRSRAASEEDRQKLRQLEGPKKGIADEDLKQESPVKVKEASPECEESLKAVEEKVLPESQGQLSEQEAQEVTSTVMSKTSLKLEMSVNVQITSEGIKTGSIGAGGEGSDLEDETGAAGGAGSEEMEAGSATGGGEEQTEGGSSTEGGEQTEAGSRTGGGEEQTEGGSSTEGGQPPKKPGSCKRRRRRSSINRRRQVAVRTA